MPSPTRSAAVAAFDPASVQLQQIGRIEGTGIRSMDLDGDLLALSGINSLTFYDVADKAYPRTLSTITLPSTGADVEIAGDFVYASWGTCDDFGTCNTGFDVYDLAMPTAPLLTARLTDVPVLRSLQVFNDTGYANVGRRIARLDLRNPAAPVISLLADSMSAPLFGPLHVDVRTDLGDRHFSYTQVDNSLAVYDLGAERQVSEFVLPANGELKVRKTEAITTSDGRHIVYVADSNHGVFAVDITDPAAPQVRAFVALPEAWELAVGPGVLYVVAGKDLVSGQLYTLDLTDPAAPVLSSPLPEYYPGYMVADDDLLVAFRRLTEIALYDLATPSTPARTGVIPLSSAGRTYTNGHLFAVGEREGLVAVDIRRPAAPQKHVTGVEIGIGWPNVVTSAGDYLLLGSIADGWRLFNVADPAMPRLLTRFEVPAGQWPAVGALEYRDGSLTAYLASSCPYLSQECSEPVDFKLYDLSEPTAPRLSGSVSLPAARKLAVHDGYAYVLYDHNTPENQPEGEGKLLVVDARNRAAPRILGTVPFKGYAHNVAAAEGRVYIAASWSGLHTIDVANPAAPRLRSTYSSGSRMEAYSIAVDGPTVFLSTLPANQLYTLDLSDPDRPRLVERAQLPGTSGVLLLVDDMLVTSGSGVAIYRRGKNTESVVRDARGAPMTDIGVELTAGGLGTALANTAVRATDLSGALALDRANSAGALLAPTFRDAVFSPPSRRVGEAGPLDFVMLGPPATVNFMPGQVVTVAVTDTQGLVSRLEVPAGALSAPAAITLRPTYVAQAGALRFAGQAFELSHSGGQEQLAEPAVLTVRYSRADVRSISNLTELALYRRVAGMWERASQSCLGAPEPMHDLAARTLRVTICTTGEYALLGPSVRVNLPLISR
jgi:hypothetical protein